MLARSSAGSATRGGRALGRGHLLAVVDRRVADAARPPPRGSPRHSPPPRHSPAPARQAPLSSPAAARRSSTARPMWPSTATPARGPSACWASRALRLRSGGRSGWPRSTSRTPTAGSSRRWRSSPPSPPRSAGADGDYSGESSVGKLRPLVEAAGRAGVYVVLDLQPGRSTFLSQAKRYRDLLVEPHVGLALDPEWRLKPRSAAPRADRLGAGRRDQRRDARWLADLTRDAGLPQKMLLLHQFRTSMITNRSSPGHLAPGGRRWSSRWTASGRSRPSAPPGGPFAGGLPTGSSSAGRTSSTRTVPCSARRRPWRSAPSPDGCRSSRPVWAVVDSVDRNGLFRLPDDAGVSRGSGSRG